MGLELKQIKEILQRPAKKRVIQNAVNLQRRLRFHTETNVKISDINSPTTEFLEWVRGFLPKDKFTIFTQLFKFPLPTPEIVEDVYRELERVFYSRNSSTSYQFTDSELAEDWASYRKNKLNEPDIWKTVGWKRMQVSPNSILVVDLPTEQTSERPEPYFYWLEIDAVIDYKTDDNQSFEWLVFNQPNNRIAVFDTDSIRVYQLNEKREIESLVSEALHDLGYCPARFFWSVQLNEKNKDLKKNPITKEMSHLDWYLFFVLSKKHLDLYAPYPIYSTYEADCNFENAETGDYCDGGFLRNRNREDAYVLTMDGSIARCPCCGEKALVGPGSVVSVPPPNQSEGVADMRNPVQITTIDKDSLEYNVTECKRLKDEIIVSIVGSGGTVSEKEAINETQVAANFENKTTVLNALKTNFEQAQKFVDDTVCKFRYGKSFISSSISWGTEFYVFTSKELHDKYDQAKKAGASNAELDAITDQILEVEYRNNPLLLQRMQILRQLEPCRHKTLNEVMSLVNAGLVTFQQAAIKVNFSSLIDRFERENINIIEFASNRPLREKIDIITKKLEEYVKQDGLKSVQKASEGAGQDLRNGGSEV